jgi:tetratricopeptide (TPR) repeat protein
MLVMLLLRLIAGAVVALAPLTGQADAAERAWRAGRIEAQRSPCLIAKLNPQTGKHCEAPLLVAGESGAQRAAVHLRRALFFIDVREFDVARREIDAGLDAGPDDFELRLISARLALTVIDVKRAEQDAKLALKLKPKDSDARATLIESIRTNSNADHAAREFSAILADDPRHDYSRLARSKLLQQMGLHRGAVEDLDGLIERRPDDVGYFMLRAASRVALGDARAAAADFDNALRLNPGDIIALTGRAQAYELIGDDERALADYDAVLGPVGSQPNYALGGDRLGKYRAQRAFLLVRMKRFDDAAADMAATLFTGKPSILRAQVFLRQNGFPDLPIDGRDSTALRGALQACLGLQSCFQEIARFI